eukprot:1159406-Pelagomonas_calceolata.AAC.13
MKKTPTAIPTRSWKRVGQSHLVWVVLAWSSSVTAATLKKSVSHRATHAGAEQQIFLEECQQKDARSL